MTEPTFPVARSIYHVPVDLIDADGGLRPLDQNWVVALASLLETAGQEDPIEIYAKPGGRYGMTAGRHRLAAVRLNGWTTIDADILDRTGLDRRAREVSENLFRRDLSPLDRAAFVAEQVAIERARAGVSEDVSAQSVAANARWSAKVEADASDASDMMSAAYGWTDAVAEAAGLTARTIRRDLELHRGIKPDVAAAIRALPVAANAAQLRTLARLPEGDQRAVAGLIAEGTAKDVTGALGTLKQKPVPSPRDKAWSAIQGNWGRLSTRDQKDLLRALALPRGVVLTIDGETVGGAE